MNDSATAIPGRKSMASPGIGGKLTALALGAGAMTALVGGVFLVTWLRGRMSELGSVAITMKTNTALGLLLLGSSLLLLARPRTGRAAHWIAGVMALCAFSIGLLTFIENISGWDLGIDQLIASEPPGALGVTGPNRMGFPASTSFMLYGLALLLIFAGPTRCPDGVPPMRSRRILTAQWLALVGCMIALLSTIGFLYGIHLLYGVARLTGIAWPTALTLLLLGIGVLCLRPCEGLMAQICTRDPGGLVARRLLIPSVLLPIVLGWARLAGERLGWYDTAMGTAMLTLVFILWLSVMTYQTARWVSTSTSQLALQKEFLGVTLKSIGDGVIACDMAGRVTFLNPVAQALCGWSHKEAIGEPLDEVFRTIDEQSREPAESIVGRALRERRAIEISNHTCLTARDGREIPIEDSAAPMLDRQGNVTGVVLVIRDVTVRRRDREALRSVALFPEQNPSPVLRLSHGGDLMYANPTGREYLDAWQWQEGAPLPPELLAMAPPANSDHALREFEIASPDGRIFSFVAAPIPGERYVNLYGREITGRKHQEDSLRLRNERLALLSQAAEHLMRADDPEVMVRQLFEMVCRHLKLDAFFHYLVDESGRVLKRDSSYGVPPALDPAFAQLEFGQAVCGRVAQSLAPVHATGLQKTDAAEVALLRQCGLRAYCCNPLMVGDRLLGTLGFGSGVKDRFDDDEVEFMGLICHYVAMAKERVRLETELRRRVCELAAADQRKDEFLAMLAHELRNPLAPIRNAAAVLRLLAPAEPRLKRQLEVVDRQVTHMGRLLDDLLDVSRVSLGKIQLDIKPVELSTVIAHAVETISPLIEARRQQLTLEQPDEPLRLTGDPHRLAQIVGNLLSNASKYTGEDGEITLKAWQEDDHVVIQVRDTGMGIEPEMLSRVFELFTQADRSLAHAQGGLGIGLTMVQNLVHLHGGTVEAYSAGLGHGSQFTVRLPAMQASLSSVS